MQVRCNYVYAVYQKLHVVNWEFNKVYLYQKYVVNWWRCVILIVEVQFFRDTVYMTLYL